MFPKISAMVLSFLFQMCFRAGFALLTRTTMELGRALQSCSFLMLLSPLNHGCLKWWMWLFIWRACCFPHLLQLAVLLVFCFRLVASLGSARLQVPRGGCSTPCFCFWVWLCRGGWHEVLYGFLDHFACFQLNRWPGTRGTKIGSLCLFSANWLTLGTCGTKTGSLFICGTKIMIGSVCLFSADQPILGIRGTKKTYDWQQPTRKSLAEMESACERMNN